MTDETEFPASDFPPADAEESGEETAEEPGEELPEEPEPYSPDHNERTAERSAQQIREG
jgi:hypothetical protein